jgi:hypothetical protein
MFTLLTPHTWYLLLYIVAKKKWTVCWEDIEKDTDHFDQVRVTWKRWTTQQRDNIVRLEWESTLTVNYINETEEVGLIKSLF